MLQSLPPMIQGPAKQLLDKIRPFVSRSDSGELIYKDAVVPYSNAAELLTEVLQQTSYRDPDPVGWPQFAKTIKEADVPEELIRRAAARTYINQLSPKVVKRRGRKKKKTKTQSSASSERLQQNTPVKNLLGRYVESS